LTKINAKASEMKYWLVSVLTVCLGVLALQAAAQNKTISDFKLIDAKSQEAVTLSSFKDKKGVVLIFTSNFCPYSKLYDKRIKAIAGNYPDVQFMLINSNDPVRSKHDSMDEMAKKAEASGYTFPYLADKGQVVSSLLGATKTPEAYVLVYKGGKFEVVFHGSIDDNPQSAENVNTNYLKEAIEAVINKQPQKIETVRPTGCMIKKS